MSHTDRHRTHAALLPFLAVIVVACAQGASSATPAASASATPGPIATASPSSSGTSRPTTPTTPVPTPAPTTTPAPSAATCTSLPQMGSLPSDRVTGVEVFGLPGRDVIRFAFGAPSLTPAGSPIGSLTTAAPPYTEAASGRSIDLAGEHALQVTFRRMSIMNDVGQPTFDGLREIRASDPSRSLRHVVLFDESEGQIGWYIGYDGSPCVTIGREGSDIIVALDFGQGG